MKLEHGTPMDIEGKSMRIIREELEAQGIVLPPDRAAVVLRAIHTTADFDYAQNLWFTPGAVEAGVAALKAGTPIVTDTNMAARGGMDQAKASMDRVARLLEHDPMPAPSEIEVLDREFIRRNLSPGGCADLLAVTLFLHDWQEWTRKQA